MKTTSSLTSLKELSKTLFDLSIDDKEQVEKTINEICFVYQDASGITGTSIEPEYITNVPTEVGVSLSLNHAASCMTDYRRTQILLKGAVQAVRDLQEKYPGETIQFFYAGCGPLAPFMTMVAPFFSPEEIQFTLLEVNKKSIQVVKDMIENLELSNYVREYYAADAITFEIPDADSYHILFST